VNGVDGLDEFRLGNRLSCFGTREAITGNRAQLAVRKRRRTRRLGCAAAGAREWIVYIRVGSGDSELQLAQREL